MSVLLVISRGVQRCLVIRNEQQTSSEEEEVGGREDASVGLFCLGLVCIAAELAGDLRSLGLLLQLYLNHLERIVLDIST